MMVWLCFKENEIDFFGCGDCLRYVYLIMLLVDGCFFFGDVVFKEGGMELLLYLDLEVMEKLFEDLLLFL